MNRILLTLLLLYCPLSHAQNLTYLTVENGLSSRKVYSIQKDRENYFWFLTQDGIDKFNGKQFRHYTFDINSKDFNYFINFNQLHIDASGNVWVINRNGKLFQYNHLTDKFQLIKKVDIDKKAPISYAHIDTSNNVWLCTAQNEYIYNIDTQNYYPIDNNLEGEISNIIQLDKEKYCIGTSQGVHIVQLSDKKLELISNATLDSLHLQVSSLFYSKELHKIIIGCFLKGIYIFDTQNYHLEQLKDLEDVNISCIKKLNNKEVLMGTDGAGIYKMDLSTLQLSPYIVADYNEPNTMNGNNINDLYVDGEKRIWIANYPIGVTIFNRHFPSYKWIKHSIGNKNSLINDQVNSIIEDSDGDLWFATNNGISCYNPWTDTWTNLLSSFHSDAHNKNHIFMSICEIIPNIILTGGSTSGLYWIDKRTMEATYIVPKSFGVNNKADKYVRSILRDSQNRVWVGGFYYLKFLDINDRKIEIFPGIKNIKYIIEEDANHMWVGNADGVYFLDIPTRKFHRINLPYETISINTLYRDKNGILYIGTSGNGLLIYNPQNHNCENYRKENCALISNNIYSILADGESLILGTENSLTRFNIHEKSFHNWTKEQGLMTTHFNIASGTTTKRNTIIVGSGNGAVEFKKGTSLPEYDDSKLIFSDFQLFYQTIHPGDENSPLSEDINKAKVIHLNHNQNIFSLYLSTINYDYPSQAIYTWKLEGFYNKWKKTGSENIIRYTNLNPGKYRLHVRAISSEDYHIIQERNIDIIISPPFWKTIWAMIIYCVVIVLLAGGILRYYLMKKERSASSEKINFFVNTAHDIRTPLTLIKAPLNDLLDKENLSEKGEENLATAIRSTNSLLRLVSNLINFEKTSESSLRLNIGEYELRCYLDDTLLQFKPYAEVREIQLTLETNFRFLNVWFDKEKMDSIVRNLISNALKYTPNGGSINVIAYSNSDSWSIEVKDTGIGISEKEQKKLFKMFYRASNAINMKTPGSGIGLLLVKKLVKKHQGDIKLRSILNEGSSFTIRFKHGNKHFKKVRSTIKPNENLIPMPETLPDKRLYKKPQETIQPKEKTSTLSKEKYNVLIVEDNDELSSYLQRTLSGTYNVFAAANGAEGLEMAKAIKPNLIISDIMMPIMRGDEMASHLKSDIETSHIPIILLTALTERNDIISGLRTNADRYITKPFDIEILKAVISNILENRALLAKQYAQLDIEELECINCSSSLDYQFMRKVKEIIDENINNNNFNVETLSSKLNMSRTSCYNKIKALTEQAPADFIRTQRLNLATKLLKEGKYNISEIAEMSGFNDGKYFREVFKKYFNMTPSQYIDSIDLNEKQ